MYFIDNPLMNGGGSTNHVHEPTATQPKTMEPQPNSTTTKSRDVELAQDSTAEDCQLDPGEKANGGRLNSSCSQSSLLKRLSNDEKVLGSETQYGHVVDNMNSDKTNGHLVEEDPPANDQTISVMQDNNTSSKGCAGSFEKPKMVGDHIVEASIQLIRKCDLPSNAQPAKSALLAANATVTSTTGFNSSMGHSPKGPLYVAHDIPYMTRFTVRVHPRVEEVCAIADAYFVENWPFRTDEEREKFPKQEVNKWVCMAIPMAWDDRIIDCCKLNTLLFLLDGESCDMPPESILETNM